MPEQAPNARPLVGTAMMISAVTLFVAAALIYTGIIPVAEDVRFIVALAIGGAAFLDLLVCMWFFRAGQSS